MNLHRFARVAVGFVLAISVPAAARAQTVAVVMGSVIDAENKSPIAEALVTVTSPAMQGEQIGGHRQLRASTGCPNLPARHVHRPGGQGRTTSLRAARDPCCAPPPPCASTGDARARDRRPGRGDLDRRADAPTVDVGSSSVGTTISNEMVQRVPIARPGTKGGGVRSFESVAEAAPEARGRPLRHRDRRHHLAREPLPHRRAGGEQHRLRHRQHAAVGGVHQGGERGHRRLHARIRPRHRRHPQRGHQDRLQRVRGSVWSNVTPGVLEGDRKVAAPARAAPSSPGAARDRHHLATSAATSAGPSSRTSSGSTWACDLGIATLRHQARPLRDPARRRRHAADRADGTARASPSAT